MFFYAGKMYHGNNKKYNRGKKESIKEKMLVKIGLNYILKLLKEYLNIINKILSKMLL